VRAVAVEIVRGPVIVAEIVVAAGVLAAVEDVVAVAVDVPEAVAAVVDATAVTAAVVGDGTSFFATDLHGSTRINLRTETEGPHTLRSFRFKGGMGRV
jgi:hypothetical protein